MDGKSRYGHSRVISYTRTARKDFADAILATANRWGKPQATAYRRHLKTTLRSYADHPETAVLLDRDDNIRMGLASWPNARDGHRIFYKEIPNGILVVRILHTKRNWQDHI